MKLLQKRLPLFICLLLFFTTTEANNSSSQNSFEFLTHPLENVTLVNNGPALAKGIGEVSLSTVINTGIWWTVCKAPGFISAMASRYSFTATEKHELASIKSDFCLQLAPLIATTETVLAGQVSPWPIAPLWWRSIFLTGAGMATYGVIASHLIKSTPENIATTVLAYLAADGVSRTAGSAASTAILKKTGKTHIKEADYYSAQYSVLALVTGFMTSSIIHQILLHNGVGPAKACFISAVSAIAASSLSQTISIHNADYNIRENIFYIAISAVAAAVTAGVTTGGITGLATLAKTKTKAISPIRAISAATAIAIAVAISGAGTGAGTGALEGAKAEDSNGAIFGAILGAVGVAIAGTAAGAVTGTLSIVALNKLAPDNSPLKIAGAVAIATSFALINSLSGFAAYGYPLERSLSKTTQTLWNKFLAPLDYLATLFPQLLSEHELEGMRSH